MNTYVCRFCFVAVFLMAISGFGQNPGWTGTEQLQEGSHNVSISVEIATDNQGNTISGF